MAKRRTKRAEARAKKKLLKEQGMHKPSGKSTYGKKGRAAEIARGYSKRINSPFYMSQEAVKQARGGVLEPEDMPDDEQAGEVAA